MFAFAPDRPRRRPGLTPMIDVVFLLLVFFMLAARFGSDVGLSVTTAGGSGTWQGPPRLIDLYPDRLTLNGVETGDIAAELAPLITDKTDLILLRPRDGADTQRVLDALSLLRAAGFPNVALVEGRP